MSPAQAVRVVPMRDVEFGDFSGGLNLRDAPTELQPNESPYMLNVVLDERGGITSRLGISLLNGSSALPAAPDYLYYSAVADALLAYINSTGGFGKLYKSTDGGATWSAAYSAFTAGAVGAIVDFNNRVVVVNTVDGVYSFPASLAAPTHTAGGTANMEAVRGACVCTWQNKCYVAGDVNNKPRVWWCNKGNELLWTIASDWVDLREVNDDTITAIGAGAGLDAQSKPTLHVFKSHSWYRINDSATGAYTTLDPNGAGAISNQAVAAVNGKIIAINDRGVWQADAGTVSPYGSGGSYGATAPKRVSGKIDPLFFNEGVAKGVTKWYAGVRRDRAVFSIPRAGSSTPNMMLEYSPDVGWFTQHSLAIGPMALYTKATQKLIGADPSSGNVYEVFKGGTDNGASFTATWQSRYIPVANGATGRLRRLRAWGRGIFDVYVLCDFTQGAGDRYPMDFTTNSKGFVWDVDKWDVGVWADALYEDTFDQPLDEVTRFFSIKATKVCSTSASSPPILANGSSYEVGAFAFYQMRCDFVPLGNL